MLNSTKTIGEKLAHWPEVGPPPGGGGYPPTNRQTSSSSDQIERASLSLPRKARESHYLQHRRRDCNAPSYALRRRRYSESCAIRLLRSTPNATTCCASGLNKSRVGWERAPQSARILSVLSRQSSLTVAHLLMSPDSPTAREVAALRRSPHCSPRRGYGQRQALLPCPPWEGYPPPPPYI